MTARGLASPRANSAAISLIARSRHSANIGSRPRGLCGDRDRRAVRDHRRREPRHEIQRQERRVAGRGGEKRKPSPAGVSEGGGDAAQRPGEARPGRVGDDVAIEAVESRRLAVGVDEELGHLRAQAPDDVGDERAAGEREQRLLRAHARRAPAREHDAGD